MEQGVYMGEMAEILPGQKVKLDLKDIKILNALADNARYPITTIAKKANISRELATYRLNRLQDKKVINGFVALLNPKAWGYLKYDVYLRFQKMHEEKEEEIIEKLKQDPGIIWIATIGGNYDVGLQVSVKSVGEFDKKLSNILSICGDYLSNHTIINVIHECTSPWNLSGGKAESTKHKGKPDGSFKKEIDAIKNKITEKKAKIDDKDKKILNILASDARASMIDISKKVDLSPNAVNYRIKNLIEQGVITDFIAIPSYPLLGLEWNIVLLKFKNFTPENEKKFLYFIGEHPYIDYYAKGVGNWNYQISLLSKDPMHLRKILMEMRAVLKDTLQEYESVRVFNQHKFVATEVDK